MFEGTKEEQIERQKEQLRAAMTPDGKRVYPDGYAFMAYWKDEEGVVQYEAAQI
ncbi:hypothetical protein VPA32_orf049 [Klebsiella phage vB_KpnM_VPA32]|jgi:hypothetical protein|uniref:Uncharacterized protein 43.1 n=1 Tax=Enterobacter phage CC31 TaxID=709484 RepID=E5DI55_9CAUD|nr:gp43.1 hypothetical protein [Enterobacter phage CC31]URQ04123.1 hypothetical protein vBEclMUFV01_155 [Enterobacter phage vB_EclM-UFV01]WFG78477.1 hypothetical protein VIPECLOM01_00045 [Enterobacter phage vB_VIPECLOM01]WFG78765.1 hypothetical protein VIPECLUMC02_00045 [Enterobacter phage vB_VIPECLUMC02]WJJ59014.1 hypothetical protein VPA32_orf049 [Klebsiella phage vB_KpnM_VPA32]ADB81540.1 gp43.1 hypothetical protein [Enterobacter phage CC31]